MNLSQHILQYYQSLSIPFSNLPNSIEWIDNVFEPEVIDTMTTFYNKYYSDKKKRYLLLGINPGRFGAGVTGVPFTDPVNLEEKCQIKNNFNKRHELSSRFIYEVADAFGGPDDFYQQVYISSVSPLGFLKEGKNINYYDDKALQKLLWNWMKEQIEKQLQMGMQTDVVFSIGAGQNLKALKKMNYEEGWFNKVESLPHPRWVMQYRLKRKQEFIDEYLQKIGGKARKN